MYFSNEKTAGCGGGGGGNIQTSSFNSTLKSTFFFVKIGDCHLTRYLSMKKQSGTERISCFSGSDSIKEIINDVTMMTRALCQLPFTAQDSVEGLC